MTLKETCLDFLDLAERVDTEVIVIHHSDGGRDVDFSAAQIHQMHLNIGYSGIGYHYVIRKDGTVERGRREWAVGAHAEGHNYYTLGICLSGDFTLAQPTDAQLDALVELLRDLCNGYDIPIDRRHIIGHRELNATDCPGDNLYRRLDEIVTRLIAPPAYTPRPVTSRFDILERYFAGNIDDTDPFGLFKLSGVDAHRFALWLSSNADFKHMGDALLAADDFVVEWTNLAAISPADFRRAQELFAAADFFEPAARLLADNFFHLDRHTVQLQAVAFALAFVFDAARTLRLFQRACRYPNLSYIDSHAFDRTTLNNLFALRPVRSMQNFFLFSADSLA